ncbi:siderophore-interacting protein [Chryseobacterium sp. T1]
MKNIYTDVYHLKKRTYITPHYIRLALGNENIDKVKDSTFGSNNKVYIAPAGKTKVHFPEFNYEKMEWKPMSDDIKPHIRTYTHRGINLENKEIYVDFVAHGDEGPASNFAINAPIGSELGISMKTDPSPLYPDAEDYLLVGDATAIPVLACILESLPADVQVHTIIEVISPEDIHTIETNAKASFEWIINPTPAKNSTLAAKAKAHTEKMNPKSRFAYIAAEFSAVKEIRTFLRKEKSWTKDELYAYSYWKFGKSETGSEKERREELSE